MHAFLLFVCFKDGLNLNVITRTEYVKPFSLWKNYSMWEPFDQKYDINLSQTMAFNFSPYGFLATFAYSPFILCGMVNAIPVQISKKLNGFQMQVLLRIFLDTLYISKSHLCLENLQILKTCLFSDGFNLNKNNFGRPVLICW